MEPTTRIAFVSKEKATELYAICKSCEEFNSVIKKCNVCHCFMPFKVRWGGAQCPKNKWAEQTATQEEEYFLDENA